MFELKTLIKNIIQKLLSIKDEFIWTSHIKKVCRRLNINRKYLSEEFIRKHKEYWHQLKPKVNTKWFEVYSFINNNPDIRYVPENIYFNLIENKLNNRKLALAFADKNFYDLFYNEKNLFPETILRNIDGTFYDKEYKIISDLNEENLSNLLRTYEKFLIKPSVDSGGGKKVQLFNKINGNFVNTESKKISLDYLNHTFVDNYIVQNYIDQHDYFKQFNLNSVNTIRIFTYRSVSTDEIFPLHAILRIGKKGNYLDDQNVGGVACRINEDSTLNDYATNYWGEKFFEFNGIVFSKTAKVPYVDKMKQTAAKLAEKNIHSRVLGFDFAVNSDNQIKLIEINHLWTGINFFQMNSTPLFGKFTDEVISFCKNKF